MASSVGIANRALQILGASRIVSLSDASVSARAMASAYDSVRLMELRVGPIWSFAIKRAQLAASAMAPEFGRANSFQVPSDFVRLAPQYPEDSYLSRDWVVEGRSIVTDDAAPLQIRYVADVSDPNLMDPAFRESFAYALAMACCEELTQSNTKQQLLAQQRSEVLSAARKTNSIENVPIQSATDEWLTVRL